MRVVTATTRIAIGLLCLTLSVGLVAYALGMFPNRQRARIDGRADLSENVALNCSLLASKNDNQTMKNALEGLVRRNDDVLSAAIRNGNGQIVTSVGPHVALWDLPAGTQSTGSQMRVPIMAGDRQWGTVEVRFRDLQTNQAWYTHPFFVLGAFGTSACYLLYFMYLRKMLRHLDPSRVIPPRVRQTLDTLAEGLLVLDCDERILLANQSFADKVDCQVDQLIGRLASDLPWETDPVQLALEGYPWRRAIEKDHAQLGELLTITGSTGQERVLKVSATPVYGEDGSQRGTMVSFDDVTEMEQSRVDLRKMLDSLSESRDEIHRQNLELERLASRDSLTDCLNRRAFFPDLENHWRTAERHQLSLACVMVDLDHFKAINDTHGHHAGDTVLQKVSDLLRTNRRPSDLICRYGGEEFCLLLLHTNIEGAAAVAEKIRAAIEACDFNGLSVTASLGVSARSLGATHPQEMIEQADRCLYVAKRQGRNRVVRFDHERTVDVVEVPEVCESNDGEEVETADTERGRQIPFHAVTALVSALAYRDPATGDHSRRVADLCVATSRRLMSSTESYLLEIAALLHDIGKIGVPDSILLKPGKLNEDEWRVMNAHERIGAEIVESTFSCPLLTEVISTYRAWYGGHPRLSDFPKGEAIPLAARILAIADAYDAMTQRSAYREPLTHDQAVEELRRCAGKQFDPVLTERFIDALDDRNSDQIAQKVSGKRHAALSFGPQIHRLAEAVEKNDVEGISVLARRLQMMAASYQADEVEAVAGRLREAASEDTDVKDLAALTNDLVELCRSTQRAYLDEAVGSAGAIARQDGESESNEELLHA